MTQIAFPGLYLDLSQFTKVFNEFRRVLKKLLRKRVNFFVINPTILR